MKMISIKESHFIESSSDMACSLGTKLLVLLYCVYAVSGSPYRNRRDLTEEEKQSSPYNVLYPERIERRLERRCNEVDAAKVYKLEQSDYNSGHYQKAAVAGSSPLCTKSGADIMKRGGNAIDAAIATLLCDGVVSLQGMGIGGGFLMTIWNATEKKAYFLNAREYAPAAASERLFTPANRNESVFGVKAIGVPGEVAGYWAAHQKFGKLPWKELFKDVINICKRGFYVTPYIESDIVKAQDNLNNPAFTSLYEVVRNRDGNAKFVCVDHVIKRPLLAKTLEKIRDQGQDVFYKGEIAETLTQEIQAAGGIISLDDFKNYTVEWKEPVSTTIKNKTLYSAPTPGSGAILVFMLNVLENLIPVENGKSEKDMWQRIAETFKWGYARRNELGDFVNRTEYLRKKTYEECLIENLDIADFERVLVKEGDKAWDRDCLMSVVFYKLLSKEYADQVRALIDDNKTYNDYEHYNITKEGRIDHGTAHTSVVDEDGSAVSVTSTINHLFGSMFRSNSTGIILNNEMDDYSYPGITNGFGVEPSEFNFVRNKSSPLRPMSSMVPTIILNEDQTVRLVIGSAGGTKITTGVAQGIIHNLFLNKNIKDSLIHPRIHHNLWPMALQTEDTFKEQMGDIWDHLNTTVGHTMDQWLIMNNTLAAVAVNGPNDIDASGDYRRQGGAWGF